MTTIIPSNEAAAESAGASTIRPPEPCSDPSFWEPHPIAPIAALAELREQVLRRSEKRYPKWKFRLAPDLVVQVQPKAVPFLVQWTVLFEARAYFGVNLTRETFTKRRRGGAPLVFFSLHAADYAPDSWWLTPTRATVQTRDAATGQRVLIDPERQVQRLVDVLTPATFANLPSVMLSPNCLICGKGLTDPASMARYIGPECAGSSSLVVPRTLSLVERDRA